jgi:hypothetical protein
VGKNLTPVTLRGEVEAQRVATQSSLSVSTVEGRVGSIIYANEVGEIMVTFPGDGDVDLKPLEELYVMARE